jgi:hypothetical protein
VKAALQHCYDPRDYSLLNSTFNILSKKHGQLKAVVQAMVELCISWLPEIKERDGVDRWLELVETVRSVTEGKVSVLIEMMGENVTDIRRSSWKPHAHELPLLSLIITKACQSQAKLKIQQNLCGQHLTFCQNSK